MELAVKKFFEFAGGKGKGKPGWPAAPGDWNPGPWRGVRGFFDQPNRKKN